MQFLRAITAKNVRDMILFYFLSTMSTRTYGWYVCLGTVMLRHLCLMEVVQELNEGLPSRHCLGRTTLDDVVSMKCDRKPCSFIYLCR